MRSLQSGDSEYAARQGLNEADALEAGMQEKAKEFADKGAEIYLAE